MNLKCAKMYISLYTIVVLRINMTPWYPIGNNSQRQYTSLNKIISSDIYDTINP